MMSRREFSSAAITALGTFTAADAVTSAQQPAPSDPSPAPLKTEFLMDIVLDVAAPQSLGTRRIVPVTGGTFEGPKLKGTALGGGGDWILVRPDGASELNVRVTLKTDDDQLIYLTYRGLLYTPKGGEQVLADDPGFRNRFAEIRLADPHHRRRRRTPRAEQGGLQHLSGSLAAEYPSSAVERRANEALDVGAHPLLPANSAGMSDSPTHVPSGVEGAHLVLYDGVCGLCSRLIQFLLEHDHRSVFRFASLQSATGRAMVERFGGNPDDLTSVRVVANYRDEARMFSRSSAALFVARELGWPWKAAAVMGVMPTAILDHIYNLVARTRYALFGRLDVCLTPRPEFRHRFIDP